MSGSNEAPGARLHALWRTTSRWPGGRWLFGRLLAWMVPYSGTIGARVERFEPGRVTVSLPDRRRVRNHLRSVHAIALANLGELATGLAVLGALGSEVRGILTGIEVTYRRKARGRIVAAAVCDPPHVEAPIDHTVEVPLTDDTGEVVAVVRAQWRLSPVPAS